MRFAFQAFCAYLCTSFVLGAIAHQPALAQLELSQLFEDDDILLELQSYIGAERFTRLPRDLRTERDGKSDTGISTSISILPGDENEQLQLALQTCPSHNDQDCIKGFITTLFSSDAAAELERHRLKAYPITLSDGIEGYLIPSAIGESGQAMASVMWQQDSQYYKIEFPDSERQSILYMAHSMANAEPIIGSSMIQGKQPKLRSAIAQKTFAEPNQDRMILPDALTAPVSDSETVLEKPNPNSVSPSHPNQELLDTVNQLVEIEGSTVFNTAESLELFNEYIRNNPEKQIQHLIAHITEVYVGRGFITSTVSSEPRAIRQINRKLYLTAVEGTIDNLKVCWIGDRRFNPNYVVERIKLGIGTRFNYNNLENSLRLLKADPRFQNIEATLREPSEEQGQGLIGTSTLSEDCPYDKSQWSANGENSSILSKSDLQIKVTEAPLADFSIGLNNHAPPSVGSQRLEASFLTRALWGKQQGGDELQASIALTRKLGLKNLDLSYRRPLNAMQGTLEARASLGETEVVQEPFDELEIRGTSQRYELNFRQPVLRRYDEELALTTGFTYQSGQTFLFENLPSPFGFGPDEDGISRTSTFKFGQSYVKRDPQGAWSFGSQFNLGVGWLDATVNEAPIPDSRFFSWLGLAQRSQRLGDNHLLVFQSELQLTPNSLLPSQQFVIGGAQSIRGYRQNARSGDNGFRVRLEDRVTVKRDGAGRPLVQLIPFWDVGSVWNAEANPNQPPKQRFLSSLGLGAQWNKAFNVDGLVLRFDYGIPLNQLDEPEQTLQDAGFHFGLSYQRAIDLDTGPGQKEPLKVNTSGPSSPTASEPSSQ